MDESTQAIALLIDDLSPEAKDAFVRVYELLLDFGLQGLAEHPERAREMAERAAERP